LPNPRHHLHISAWRLYHAAKKAELAYSFTTQQIDHLACCFANEHHEAFRWNGQELRLTSGVTDMYESAAQASRARLIGEGMLLLAMQHKGYAFWDRLDLLVKRALRKQALKHPESVQRARAIRKRLAARGNRKRCDFVLENAQRETALAEAKGAFCSPSTASPIKSDLREALQQLAATKPLISPQPAKSYAIGTYLREEEDRHNEGSLIALVETDGQDGADVTVELPPGAVRRGNYGAWLVGMGFPEAGNALRNSMTREEVRVSLPMTRVGGHHYAFVVTGLILSARHWWRLLREFPDYWLYDLEDWLPFAHALGDVELTILGLRVDALESISRALRPTDPDPVLSIEPTMEIESDEFGRSIMPDGSICGAITVKSMREIEFREFTL
jgi:hypothetical protein